MLAHTRENGAGKRYLIEHSAGSGKSNSIAWLAHQLVVLQRNDKPVFDSIIVVTDRRLLDDQLNKTIKNFLQVGSTVGHADHSGDLRNFIQSGKKIIVSTVQKFPYILEEIGSLHRGRSFAIIIDEAHSSQGGKTSAAISTALSEAGSEEDDEMMEDKINRIMEAKKLLPNASYFAFTATPKNKTLEIFGQPFKDGDKTKHRPFHSYTMKQAIDEGLRLNRARPQKYDTFVLDFMNDVSTIQDAFEPYYRTTVLADETDPNKLHDLKSDLDGAAIYTSADIDEFVQVYLVGAGREKLDPILDSCVALYVENLDEDGQVDFKGKAKAFLRSYGFLSAILPYTNAEWEKLSIFLNFLVPKLPAPKEEDLSKGILETIDMDSYRVEKKAAVKIQLPDQDVEI
jgi:type I site-specific restriction-modification system R (restriction) subunit